MQVIEYVREEVWRQGHNIDTIDGIQRVGWMLNAWSYALGELPRKPAARDMVAIGKLIEKHKNKDGIRTCNVRVGDRLCPPHEEVQGLLFSLFAKRDELTSMDFYRGLLEVHPFADGNGRTGKIILNWLNGTLLNPIFPPNDFWGGWIRNP